MEADNSASNSVNRDDFVVLLEVVHRLRSLSKRMDVVYLTNRSAAREKRRRSKILTKEHTRKQPLKKKEKRNAIVVVDVGITLWYVLRAAKSPFCYATEGLKTNKPVVEDEEERLDRSNLPVLRHSPSVDYVHIKSSVVSLHT